MLRELPFFNEPFLTYTSQDHPLYARDKIRMGKLQDGNLWLLNQEHCFQSQVPDICSHHDPTCLCQELTYASGSTETLKRKVEFLPKASLAAVTWVEK